MVRCSLCIHTHTRSEPKNQPVRRIPRECIISYIIVSAKSVWYFQILKLSFCTQIKYYRICVVCYTLNVCQTTHHCTYGLYRASSPSGPFHRLRPLEWRLASFITVILTIIIINTCHRLPTALDKLILSYCSFIAVTFERSILTIKREFIAYLPFFLIIR